MRERTLASREETRIRFWPGRSVGSSLEVTHALDSAIDFAFSGVLTLGASVLCASCRIPSDPALQQALPAPTARFQRQNPRFRRAIPRPVAAVAKTGKAATILAGTPHKPGAP